MPSVSWWTSSWPSRPCSSNRSASGSWAASSRPTSPPIRRSGTTTSCCKSGTDCSCSSPGAWPLPVRCRSPSIRTRSTPIAWSSRWPPASCPTSRTATPRSSWPRWRRPRSSSSNARCPVSDEPDAVPADVVFLVDVDNTLLDNDRVTADLLRHLEREVGHEYQQRYWEIFEQLRAELGYADYLGALQRFRIENTREPGLLTVSHYLVNYPFANRLYPGSLDAVEHLQTFGPVVILSDGD